jgi:hypothetical protein
VCIGKWWRRTLHTSLARAQALTPPTHSVLALEGRNEPAEDALHALLLCAALRDLGKLLGVLAPVGGELGERGGREDDWEGLAGYELKCSLQGGAVIDDRSPVMWASDLMKLVHPAFWSCGTSAPVGDEVPEAVRSDGARDSERGYAERFVSRGVVGTEWAWAWVCAWVWWFVGFGVRAMASDSLWMRIGCEWG